MTRANWVSYQQFSSFERLGGNLVFATLSPSGSLLSLHRDRFFPAQLDIREDDLPLYTLTLPSPTTEIIDFVATSSQLAILTKNPLRLFVIGISTLVQQHPYPFTSLPLPRQITEEDTPQLVLGNYGGNLLLLYTMNRNINPDPDEPPEFVQDVCYMHVTNKNANSIYAGGLQVIKEGSEWEPLVIEEPVRIRLLKHAPGINTALLMLMSWKGCYLFKFTGEKTVVPYGTFDPNYAVGYTIGEFGPNREIPDTFSMASWKVLIQSNQKLLQDSHVITPPDYTVGDLDLNWISLKINGDLVTTPLSEPIVVDSGDFLEMQIAPTRHITNLTLWTQPNIRWRLAENTNDLFRSILFHSWLNKGRICTFHGKVGSAGTNQKLVLHIKAEVW